MRTAKTDQTGRTAHFVGFVVMRLIFVFVVYLMADKYNFLMCEPEHDKTSMTCAPTEDSDQTGYSPSLISLRCPHEDTLGPHLHTERTVKTGQPDLSLMGTQVILLVLLSCSSSLL